MREKDFDNGCFSAGWADEVEHNLTPKQRKDLVTLLLELEDMKQEFNRIAAKKDRLSNLLKFYNGNLVTE